MFNSVEYVRNVCKERGITVSALEKACGFSNGYLNPRKMTQLPYQRALAIAQYLELSVEQILTGEEKSTPVTRGAVSDDDIKFALFGGDGEITDAMFEEVKQFAAFIKQREAGNR